MTSFETWWETQKHEYANHPGVLQQYFKEISQRAWEAALELYIADNMPKR